MGGKGGRPRGEGVRHGDNYEKKPYIPLPMKHDKKEKNEDIIAIRDAIQQMLDGNLTNLTEWLTKVGENNPKEALNIFMSFSEFVLPKVQRTDSKTGGTTPIQINIESTDTYDRRLKAEANKQEIEKNFNAKEFLDGLT